MQILKCAQYFSCFKKEIPKFPTVKETTAYILRPSSWLAWVLTERCLSKKLCCSCFTYRHERKSCSRTEVSRTQMIKTCKRGVMQHEGGGNYTQIFQMLILSCPIVAEKQHMSAQKKSVVNLSCFLCTLDSRFDWFNLFQKYFKLLILKKCPFVPSYELR